MPCDPSTADCSVLLSVVAPLCGNLLALCLNVAPAFGVAAAVQKGELGDLNPLFMLMMVPASTVNLGFGYLLRDWWIVFPNLSGLTLGVAYSAALLRVAPLPRFRSLLALLFGALLAALLVTSFATVQLSPASAEAVQGLAAAASLVFLFSAPLWTLPRAVRRRDGSAVYLPVAGTMLVNACFWVAYGAAIGKAAVWGPNTVGLASAAAQIAVGLAFRTGSPGTPSRRGVGGVDFAPVGEETGGLVEGEVEVEIEEVKWGDFENKKERFDLQLTQAMRGGLEVEVREI
ncbi:hypothetical protein DFJ74DRAFT_709908 [Hyaloraphidium curvatum]|nr:hypothetical protein DFJ74DRAFT_709908 [Hyaloraphidium curvatum]